MNTFLDAEVVLVLHDESPDLREGLPTFFLYSPGKAALFEEATRFIVENCQVGSRHTWAKTAYALKAWFQYLQATECPWQDATAQSRRDFRDAYLGAVSPRTGEAYGEAGVKAQMTTVRKFYEFAARQGWYRGDLRSTVEDFEDHRAIDSDRLAHTRSARSVRAKDLDLPKARSSSRVRALGQHEIKTLFNRLGPRPTQRGIGDQRPSRDRVFAELGMCVGLRLSELNSLTTLQFLSMAIDAEAPFSKVPLTLRCGTKGKVTRTVAVPGWLAAEVVKYIEGERREALKSRRGRPAHHPPTRLFVAHKSANRPGELISNNAFQEMFEKACVEVGLVDYVEKTNPESGEKFVSKRARFSVHDLRHTYAVYAYHALVAIGDKEPWKKIQAQLGHQSLQTTLNTYLTYVDIFTDNAGVKAFRKLMGL